MDIIRATGGFFAALTVLFAKLEVTSLRKKGVDSDLVRVTQITIDYRKGNYQRAGGEVDPLPADAPQFVKDYYAYYKTPRGFHPRYGNSTDGWNTTSNLPFVNFKFFRSVQPFPPRLCFARILTV